MEENTDFDEERMLKRINSFLPYLTVNNWANAMILSFITKARDDKVLEGDPGKIVNYLNNPPDERNETMEKFYTSLCSLLLDVLKRTEFLDVHSMREDTLFAFIIHELEDKLLPRGHPESRKRITRFSEIDYLITRQMLRPFKETVERLFPPPALSEFRSKADLIRDYYVEKYKGKKFDNQEMYSNHEAKELTLNFLRQLKPITSSRPYINTFVDKINKATGEDVTKIDMKNINYLHQYLFRRMG